MKCTALLLASSLTLVSARAQDSSWRVPSSPFARKGALQILSISGTNSVAQHERIEFHLSVSATFDNPFHSAEIAIDADFRTPSGRLLRVPAFFFQDFHRSLENGRENLVAHSDPSWRIRFSPAESGQYSVQVTVRDRSGAVTSAPSTFVVSPSLKPGAVRVSRNDPRYFTFENGEPYFPIGANTCWAYARGTYDYDEWFARYGEAGCNYGRLWLSPNWTTFALERTGSAANGLGMGQFDLKNAWRIDYVLDLAQRHALKLMLCIDSYNILRQKDGYPQWDDTPHNVANGGPLAHPAEFWTSEIMDQLYRDKLRYLVARYGAHDALLSWEFWNEADITTGYKSEPSRAWHERMSKHLREIDPFDRLITTSFAGTDGDVSIDTLPGLDYVQTHHYNSPDLVQTLSGVQKRKAVYGKPHIVGEIGADSGGPRGKDDPEGLQIHDPLWVSIVTGGAGTAQPWWWDNYIHPQKHYRLFAAATRFVAGINWDSEGFRAAPTSVSWLERPRERRDLALTDGPASWERNDFNRPQRVQISTNGAHGDLPVSSVLHGLGGHRDKHNPVTFYLDLPRATRFEIEVGEVSGHGGAAIEVNLDGQPVFARELPDHDGLTNTTVLRDFVATHGFDVAPGRHTIEVRNTGRDWVRVGYRFRDILEGGRPPLLAWALVGTNTALAWARVEERSWNRICARKQIIATVPQCRLTIEGLPEGEWRAELWDTWSGDMISNFSLRADFRKAQVTLPEIQKDVAVKLRRVHAK